MGEVYVKNDAANPTHSFKDRVVNVAVAKAKELGFEVVACASTGNLANAVAAHAAAAGLDSYVFVPADLEEQKILATGVYGTQPGRGATATTTTSTGSAPSCPAEHPWAFVNVNLRPYYAEGSKTLAFEVAEQLGFELPDRVVCPVASGSLFTKIARGLRGVARARASSRARCPPSTARRPRAAARSHRRSPTGTRSAGPVRPDTIAKSLAIGNPADGVFALEVARRTGGSIDSVTDEEIVDGIQPAGRDDRHLHRDRGRRHDRGAGEAGRARRHRRPTTASCSTSPARA